MEYRKNIYWGEFWKSYEKYLSWEPLSYHKIVKSELLQSGTGFGYYIVRQLVLQCGMGCIVTKWDNFITKSDNFITMRDGYYKVGQLLQSGP